MLKLCALCANPPARRLAGIAIIAILATLCFPAKSLHAESFIVKPVLATVEGSNTSAGSPTATVDGAGLSQPLSTFSPVPSAYPSIDAGKGGASMWLAKQAGACRISFDLGADYSLTGAHIWNYCNQKAPGHAAKSISISVSQDGESFEDAGKFDLPSFNPKGKAYAGDDIKFAQTAKARYIRFDILSSHGKNEQAGLAEVRFTAADDRYGVRFPNVYLQQLRYSSSILVGAIFKARVRSIHPRQLELKLEDELGKVVLSKTVTGTEAMEGAVIPANIPAGTYKATVTTTLVDGQTEVSVSRDMYYAPTPKGSMPVAVNEDQIMTVQGKPIFPIAIYHVASGDLKLISDAGFNLVAPRIGSRIRPAAEGSAAENDGFGYVEKAADLKLKTWISGAGLLAPGNKAGESLLAYYKGNPDVLFWYVWDEPPADWLDRLVGYYENGLKLDATHPYLILQNAPDNMAPDIVNYYAKTAQAADTFSIDVYPITAGRVYPMDSVAKSTRKAYDATFGKKWLFVVLQAYTYCYKDSNKYDPPLPTLDETRCMSYLALAGGARGLGFYAFDDSTVKPDAKIRGMHLANDYPDFWNGVLAPCVKEISKRTDLWTAPASELSPVNLTPDVTVQMHPYIKDGKLYMLVVNDSRNDTRPVRIALPWEWSANSAAADTLGSGKPASVQNGVLTDSLAPMQAKCYELSIR